MIISIIVFAGACALVVYRSQSDDWSVGRKICSTIVLTGAAIALFVSQFSSIDRYPFSLEVVGSLIMLGGLLFMIFRDLNQDI